MIDLMRESGYELIADYYDASNADKYWQYSKAEIPAEFSNIVDHALIFQRQVVG